MLNGVPSIFPLTIVALLALFLVAMGVPSFFPSTNRGHTPRAVRKQTWHFVIHKNPLISVIQWIEKLWAKVVKFQQKRMENVEKKPMVKLTKPAKSQGDTLYGLPLIYAKSCRGYKLGDQEYNSQGQLQFVTFCISKGQDPKTGEEWFAIHDAFMDEGALERQQGQTSKKSK